MTEPPQPPLGATPEPSATPRTDAVDNRSLDFAPYASAVEFRYLARTLETELAEMTARAVSLSIHLPPETLVGDVQRWRDEAKMQLAELATARAALAQCEERVKEAEAFAESWRACARWDIEETETGIRICRGLHHRSADHEWENFVPAAKLAQCEEKLQATFEQSKFWAAAHAKALEDGKRLAAAEDIINQLRYRLKDGATISATDRDGKILEWLPDGTMYGGLTIQGMTPATSGKEQTS